MDNHCCSRSWRYLWSGLVCYYMFIFFFEFRTLTFCRNLKSGTLCLHTYIYTYIYVYLQTTQEALFFPGVLTYRSKFLVVRVNFTYYTVYQDKRESHEGTKHCNTFLVINERNFWTICQLLILESVEWNITIKLRPHCNIAHFQCIALCRDDPIYA